MKSEILQILRDGKDPVPEEHIVSALGLSRAAFLEHIRELEAAGYQITAVPHGLRLDASPDIPFPWEFSDRESKIHYFQEVPSTMDKARALALAGHPGFTTVIAECQTKGRGRMQRTWASAQGGLYFTVVLRPDLPPAQTYRINFAASLTLARVLQDMFNIDARVKWPNDILVNERKLCGMLSEMEADEDTVSFVNLGIGINVNNDPTPVEPRAVSLKKLLGRDVSRTETLKTFLEGLEVRLHDKTLENIINEWKEHTITLNRRVKIVTINGHFEGFARDVAENGALVLELDDGSLKHVIYGDCFL